MTWRMILLLAVLSFINFAPQAVAQSPAKILVEVHSGRKWEGFVDPTSSDQELVLRFERGRAILRRPIPWSDIKSGIVNGQPLTPDELKGQVKTLATPHTKVERTRSFRSLPSHSDRPIEDKPPLPPAKVVSIACDALLANWDADVEADGLVIYLQPLDSWQQVAAVSGTLEVELFTLQARTFHHAPFSGGRSVEPIVRWSQAVNLSDYTSRGAQMKLPFQAAHPEFDDTLGAYGLVHIKFSVPGSGVFEQTIDGVRIRPWSPLRDYLQLDRGHRFLPHETTGRGKTSWPNAYP